MSPAELIETAARRLNPSDLDDRHSGGVAAALLTIDGEVFCGVCIDVPCSMGFCAEHAAAAAMVTAGTFRIAQLVAVARDAATGTLVVLPPCGRCREFLYQLDRDNLAAEVVLNPDTVVTLAELLPLRDPQPAVSRS